MRTLTLFLLLLGTSLFVSDARAQFLCPDSIPFCDATIPPLLGHTHVMGSGGSGSEHGGGGCSQALLDNVSGGYAAYSFRKQRTNYHGKAMNLIRASDSATQDIGFKGCDFDTASAVTFCASTTCKCNKWYDQSGNGFDLVPAGVPNPPALTFNELNGFPGCVFNGNDPDSLQNTSFTAITSPFSVSSVSERTANFTTFNVLFNDSNNAIQVGWLNSANSIFEGAATGFHASSVADSTFHSMVFVIAGASSLINADGTVTTGTAQGGTTATSVNIGALGGADLFGVVEEVTIFNVGLSPGNGGGAANACENQRLYWGTSGTC